MRSGSTSNKKSARGRSSSCVSQSFVRDCFSSWNYTKVLHPPGSQLRVTARANKLQRNEFLLAFRFVSRKFALRKEAES